MYSLIYRQRVYFTFENISSVKKIYISFSYMTWNVFLYKISNREYTYGCFKVYVLYRDALKKVSVNIN